jgi:hypothetical protein
VDATGIADLEAEIAGLDQYLLAPVTTTAPDPLAADERRAVSAYLVLVHGDVEEFVERAFYDYAAECLVLDERGRVDPGLYQAVVAISGELSGQFAGKVMSPAALIERIAPLLHRKFIKPNNGIKRENVKRMATGLGLNWSQLEDECSALIASLDTLGSLRGGLAHRGAAAVGVEIQSYPDDVRRVVADVTSRLPDLIRFLGQLPHHPPPVEADELPERLRTAARDVWRWLKDFPRP